MKAVILAGGLGTRIGEETNLKPKPMIEIGGKPVLWHIMKIYSSYGINDFIICCGYKGYVIKEYFSNYYLHHSDVTFSMEDNSIEVHKKRSESWKITLVDTGLDTMTGGRLGKVSSYLENEDAFCLTYGDGLANVNISELIKFHKKHGKDATLTAVYPPGRFGALEIKNNQVESFTEKPKGDGALINGGFFVLSSNVLNRIDGDNCVWEDRPLKELAKDNNLMSFNHYGFWQPMDTLRDKKYLQDLWDNGKALWKIWE
ncbi:glucose-1-phosphate cytidylyltransferase [Candidatus Pseudothioglobus singularis]|jgi:glucose-1-phosphate cytidylyltransferase|nr:glucose-1-phosphate cytidylyltransferase [Candidatus Pseudothioglobus singularis]MDB4598724.1 glucose-1-phosphate cytidylyltransferase [Candidatus Pseudothioglobus singularis]